MNICFLDANLNNVGEGYLEQVIQAIKMTAIQYMSCVV